MPNLRSREILSFPPNSKSLSKTLEKGFIQPPSTPSKTTEIFGNRSNSSPNSSEIDPNFTSVLRRRSSRLSSKMNSDKQFLDSCDSPNTRRRLNEDVVQSNCDSKDVGIEELNDLGLKLGQESSFRVSNFETTLNDSRNDAGNDKGKGVLIEVEDDDDDEREMGKQLSLGIQGNRRKFTREEKGKGVKLNDDVVSDDVKLNLDLELSLGLNFFENDEVNDQVNDEFELLNDVNVDFELPNDVNDDFEMHDYVDNDDVDDYVNDEGGLGDEVEVDDDPVEMMEAQRLRAKKHRERFKNIARRNAARLANYTATEDPLNVAAEVMPHEQPVAELDDWPGPFSTALKIIRDRENKLNWKRQEPSSEKGGGFPLVSWVPKTETDRKSWKKVPRSLQDYCLDVLSKNADALTSLYGIPEGMRNKLTRLLCDNRRMTPHVFGLLLNGSPIELRIADCSWMEERVFEQSFEACDTRNLKVLQLDLCGHCVSDISLRKALVSKGPKGLPALTTISLKGACRVSDDGLASLVSSAPALTSLNLSQCSLLSDVGIDSIANSLGLTLQELYLDFCDGLNTSSMLPMLQRMRSLEVLSLRGLVSVSDNFVRELVKTNGEIMKELILADCVNLTDSSLEVIGEKCSQLRALDLSNLGKLTDLGLLYITNGCHKIQVLNLCRSPFSDVAISAFLEVSGESLLQLSLNNIRKVAQNTTLSLAKHCKNLESLDLSWCRCLTDEALGLIADSCLSLKLLKLFGCTQVSEVFVNGHSNPHLHIVGLKMTPILEYIKRPEFQ